MRTIRDVLWRRSVIEPVAALVGVAPGPMAVRSIHLLVLLLVMAALNAVDLLYTLFAHAIGELHEMNPIAETFLDLDLQPSLICYKILLVFAGAMMLWRLRRSPWAIGGCWVLILVYATLAWRWYDWLCDITFVMNIRLAYPLALPSPE